MGVPVRYLVQLLLGLFDKVKVFLRQWGRPADGVVGDLLEGGLGQLQHLLVNGLHVLVLLLLHLLLKQGYRY